MREFLKELSRRKVWQAALIYVAVAWVLVQVADTVLPMFDAPAWALKTFTVLLVLGFPIALVLAWAYDLAPAERKSEEKKSKAALSAADTGKSWIAVMPFKGSADNPEMAEFAEGLTDDVCAGLAHFPYLAVIARESVAGKAETIRDVPEFSRVLGARYVIEGSVRRSSESVRVSARLIEAAAGVSLWAENYTVDLTDKNLLAAGDEITDPIVATVADSFGVLVASLTRAIEGKEDKELIPNDWVLRTFQYLRHYLPSRHAEMRDGLERGVERYPRDAELWACLAQLYLNEHNFGFNPRPDPLDRALKAAEKAFELDGASQLANQQLAQVNFFRRDLTRFRSTAERAIALNPLDTNTLGILGLLFVHAGDFDRGKQITQRAMELNENHAHWCQFSWIWYHCSRGEFELALDRVSRVNISGNFWIPLATAAICSSLGRDDEAQAAVAQLLALDPEFASHARHDIEAWHFASGLDGVLIDGLERAGLALP